MGNTHPVHLGKPRLNSLPKNLTIVTKGVGGFCQFFQANKMIAPHIRTAVAQWLRCRATNRKVAGSNPDGVIGIFH